MKKVPFSEATCFEIIVQLFNFFFLKKILHTFLKKILRTFFISRSSYFKPIVDSQVLQFNSLKGLLNTLKKRQTYFIYSQCFQKHLMRRRPELSSSSGWLSKNILHLCDVCTLLVTKSLKRVNFFHNFSCHVMSTQTKAIIMKNENELCT